MSKKILAILLSVLLLIPGWLGVTGLTLLVALVPLLWISSQAEASSKGWWSVFWCALLTFLLWNVATVWWIWYATPAGPIGATVVSTTLSMLSFMTFHTISKRAPKSLAYTFLIASWIALEYWYTTSEFSWPWLLLGNGFSNDIWAVQWYEYTGLFGGSLWVLITNLLAFEAFAKRSVRGAVVAAVVAIVPLIVSLFIYLNYEEPQEGLLKVSVVQPNIHFLDEVHEDDAEQAENLLTLIGKAPSDVDYILTPECSSPDYIYEMNLEGDHFVRQINNVLEANHSEATVVLGASTVKYYNAGAQSTTARETTGGSYYDIFNSALYIAPEQRVKLHHKSRLVIGTETMPLRWFFDLINIDFADNLGQLGYGTSRVVHTKEGATIGTAICYEALYGAYFGEFVANGAEAMFIISNDCWWRDTPGYRHLFSMSALRAVEHRRAIARSANTGISGFITSRGDSHNTLGWDNRGVESSSVALNKRITLYTRYGDYIARIATFMTLLSLLYYMVYRVRRRHHLV